MHLGSQHRARFVSQECPPEKDRSLPASRYRALLLGAEVAVVFQVFRHFEGVHCQAETGLALPKRRPKRLLVIAPMRSVRVGSPRCPRLFPDTVFFCLFPRIAMRICVRSPAEALLVGMSQSESRVAAGTMAPWAALSFSLSVVAMFETFIAVSPAFTGLRRYGLDIPPSSGRDVVSNHAIVQQLATIAAATTHPRSTDGTWASRADVVTQAKHTRRQRATRCWRAHA